MPQLYDALAQISEIRAHVARTETFRGYRSATVAFSALVAWIAAGCQTLLVPEPTTNPSCYLALWITAALVCVVATAIEMAVRCRKSASNWTMQLTWLAIEQFVPCLVAGALVTGSMVRFAPESLWMLPGLWAVLFSLGIFASARLLPRAVVFVGMYYLVGGVLCLSFARGDAAFSPWAMIGTFGVGQLLAAAILYYSLERRHA